MKRLFLDTSFIIALEDADDQNHDKAVLSWKEFKKHPCKLITTTYIFDETVTFLKRRMGYNKAVDVGRMLLVPLQLDTAKIKDLKLCILALQSNIGLWE